MICLITVAHVYCSLHSFQQEIIEVQRKNIQNFDSRISSFDDPLHEARRITYKYFTSLNYFKLKTSWSLYLFTFIGKIPLRCIGLFNFLPYCEEIENNNFIFEKIENNIDSIPTSSNLETSQFNDKALFFLIKNYIDLNFARYFSGKLKEDFIKKHELYFLIRRDIYFNTVSKIVPEIYSIFLYSFYDDNFDKSIYCHIFYIFKLIANEVDNSFFESNYSMSKRIKNLHWFLNIKKYIAFLFQKLGIDLKKYQNYFEFYERQITPISYYFLICISNNKTVNLSNVIETTFNNVNQPAKNSQANINFNEFVTPIYRIGNVNFKINSLVSKYFSK